MARPGAFFLAGKKEPMEIIFEKHTDSGYDFAHQNVVRLSSDYNDGGVQELLVKQWADEEITLIRVDTDQKPCMITLNPTEFAALIEAHETFLKASRDYEQEQLALVETEVSLARELVASVCSEERHWSLVRHSPRSYTLDDADGRHLLYSMSAGQVLLNVKRYLMSRDLMEPEPPSEQKLPSDDFDPFIDSDNLP